MTLRAPEVERAREWRRKEATCYTEPTYLQTALIYDYVEPHPCFDTIQFPAKQIRELEKTRIEEIKTTREEQ